MKKLYLLILSVFLTTTFAFAGGACVGNATNTTCATNTSLTSGAACVNGTTCGGGPGVAASCFSGATCSWYSFTATATNMFVNIAVTATGGCHIRSNVFSRAGACAGLVDISCQIGAPLDDLHALSGLTVGNIYYIQVCYAGGGPCSDGANFCINVGVPDPPCNTCSTPCGTASGYAAPPSTATVVADCQTSPFVPALAASSTNTFCYRFTATNATVNFNVIITSNCGGGNVTNFSWALYNSPACGAAIQTGTLASLTFTGLTVGNSYVFCYTFTVPATCTHSQHCPYFVGATVLPVTLTDFNAKYLNGGVLLNWITETEINNDFFTIERSNDGINYEVFSTIKGAGNSSNKINYNTNDLSPLKGTSYYRLKQTDYDGNFEYFNPVAVTIKSTFDDFSIYPNPITGNGFVTFNSQINDNQSLEIYDVSGRLVYKKEFEIVKGTNKILLDTRNLTQGMYFVHLADGNEGVNLKFIKE